MSEELAKYEAELKPLTALEIRAGVNLIQEVMASVMKSGTHYGVIPGAGNKPTLLKPGAEKIMATFRLSVDPEAEDLSTGGFIRYRVKARLIWPSGRFAGAGVGEASTEEEKYKWRAVVSEAEWNATPETDRRTKFKKPYQNQPTEIKQVKTNPADLANTVLKMAKKRALVDAVLTVTAASDIFTQDIEDIPEEILQKKETSGTGKEPEKQDSKPAAEDNGIKKISTQILDVKARQDKNDKSIRYYIMALYQGNETSFYTASKEIAELAKPEIKTGFPHDLEFIVTKEGNELKGLKKHEPEKMI